MLYLVMQMQFELFLLSLSNKNGYAGTNSENLFMTSKTSRMQIFQKNKRVFGGLKILKILSALSIQHQDLQNWTLVNSLVC